MHYRYILQPLEELQVVELGSLKILGIEIDDQKDKQFKPGVYNQLKAFLESDDSLFCSIEERLQHIDIYNKKLDLVIFIFLIDFLKRL